MRPGVYACGSAAFNATHVNISDTNDATNPVGLVKVTAELREPCKVVQNAFQLADGHLAGQARLQRL